MAFQDPLESLTAEELKLTYRQLREMLRLARVTIEYCASILGITSRTIYHHLDDPRRVVPEDDIVQIIKILRGVERYKRFFHEANRVLLGEYLCAWQAHDGARITFDDHVVYGLQGVAERFQNMVQSKEIRYHALKNEGHVQLTFRLLGVEMLPVQKEVVGSLPEKPVAPVAASHEQAEVLSLEEEQEEMETEESLQEEDLV